MGRFQDRGRFLAIGRWPNLKRARMAWAALSAGSGTGRRSAESGCAARCRCRPVLSSGRRGRRRAGGGLGFADGNLGGQQGAAFGAEDPLGEELADLSEQDVFADADGTGVPAYRRCCFTWLELPRLAVATPPAIRTGSFLQTFPQAGWRLVAGTEPATMPGKKDQMVCRTSAYFFWISREGKIGFCLTSPDF